jgi:hypothetical protein
MAKAYTFTDANINSAAYRADRRPAPVSTEAKIAQLRKYLADRAEFAWMNSYKKVQQELAALEGK